MGHTQGTIVSVDLDAGGHEFADPSCLHIAEAAQHHAARSELSQEAAAANTLLKETARSRRFANAFVTLSFIFSFVATFLAFCGRQESKALLQVSEPSG
jgi:hypothetical protein